MTVSSVMPAQLRVRVEHFGSHWTYFREILYCAPFIETCQIQFWLQCEKKNILPKDPLSYICDNAQNFCVEKSCTESQHTFNVKYFISVTYAVYERDARNMAYPERPKKHLAI